MADPSKLITSNDKKTVDIIVENRYDNSDQMMQNEDMSTKDSLAKKVQKRKLSKGSFDIGCDNEIYVNNNDNEGFDVVVESSEENLSNFTKKLKTESLKEQMYQVSVNFSKKFLLKCGLFSFIYLLHFCK